MTVDMFQICHHHGNTVDPDHRDAEPTAQSIPTVSQFIGKYFNGINTSPSIVESCLYTVSSIYRYRSLKIIQCENYFMRSNKYSSKCMILQKISLWQSTDIIMIIGLVFNY